MMKKLFLTTGLAFCFGGFVMAQEPAKVAAKKRNIALSTTLKADAGSKAEMEARVKAKQKHYEALKASSTQTSTDVPANDAKSSRKKKAN